MPRATLIDRVRRVALALPDTEESDRLGGKPHFYVGGKVFAGCGQEDGVWSFGVKVGLDLQALLIQRPGIRVAKYVGRYGWISIDESALQDERELRELLLTSYGLIAGKGGRTKGRVAAPGKTGGPKGKPKTKAGKPAGGARRRPR